MEGIRINISIIEKGRKGTNQKMKKRGRYVNWRRKEKSGEEGQYYN